MESLAYSAIKDENTQIEQRAQAIVNAHPHFHGRAEQFKFAFRDEVLIVHGTVPTYYLKQVLQSVIQHLGGVRVVDNQVKVTSSAGLSSEAMPRSAK